MNPFQLRIHFDGLTTDLANAEVNVFVEDVSEADARAEVLASRRVRVPLIKRSEPVLVLTIERPPEIDPRATVAVRVHVDLDGNDTITKGDFINTTACPLPTGNSGGVADVHVHPI